MIDYQVQLRHFQESIALGMVQILIILGIGLQTTCHLPKMCNLILRGLIVLLVVAMPQNGLSYQAADQALLVSLVKTVRADWSQAVVVYLLLRGFNLVLSPNRLLPGLQGQEVAVMMHSRALSSCQLVQGRKMKIHVIRKLGVKG